MPGKLLISSAYFAPAEYFSCILKADEVMVEKEENYIKQTYRNRCIILSSQGPLPLVVPVYLGSFHKTPLKDIRIDYSKRWQQIHLRALSACYRSAPYFEFYFDELAGSILKNHNFLLDLNLETTELVLRILNIKKELSFTTSFIPAGTSDNDFRYCITPKKKSVFQARKYIQVFDINGSFVPGLSILDMIFNTGPGSAGYL